MIRFAILGAGRIGKVHGATIAASGVAQVAHVVDFDPKAAAALAAATGAKVAASVKDAINAKDVDAVLICTPTDLHAEQIEAAAKAGKAILCEKPVSLSVARIEKVLKTVEKTKANLMIGFNRRHDPNFAMVEKRIRKGDIGAVEMVNVFSRDPGPPPVSYIKRSGGLYRDMMIHDFDMARFLMGEEFVSLHAFGSSIVDPAIGKEGDVDTAVVHMRTASGRLAVITNSRRASYGYDQRIEVLGVKGMLSASNVHNTTVEFAGASGYTRDPIQNFFVERYGAAYRNELLAFIGGMKKGKPAKADGYDGLQAQKLADAATKSSQTGKPVEIK
jgi:myo-inositol 2-dehydrogenase / D-chiro-inositol 1-dehydrogenase